MTASIGRLLLVLVACSTSNACSPGANLAVPSGVGVREWPRDTVRRAVVAPASFWASFGTPALARLVEDALATNATLAATTERVARARAEVQIARAVLLPQVTAVGSGIGARTLDFTTTSSANSGYSGGLDLSYDFDLFGGNAALRRAALARSVAAQFDREASALVVATDTARAYVTHAAIVERENLLSRNLDGARELLRIISVRTQEGVSSDIDRGLQSVEVARLEAQRLSLVQSRRATMNALALLTGREAPGYRAPPARLSDFVAPRLNPGQPRDLLFRRPDIRAAEASIAAADGDVEQARAAFWPTLKLSASGLGQAAAFGGPYGATMSIAGNILAPVFDGGRLQGLFGVSEARQRESVALYRQAVLAALKESGDALDAERLSAERSTVLGGALADARATERLARRRYLEGAVDVTPVLDAQRNLIQVEDSAAQARLDRLIAAIDVYKALGGPALALPVPPALPETRAMAARQIPPGLLRR